ncbi:MAG: Flp pilus assembly protein CpaB [Thermoanaerobacteraceae bacterium]|nr:Flp pilus assembly protein CpaB [Thermoanaerobacteraceae bacterium]
MRKKLILLSLVFAIAAGVSSYYFLRSLEARANQELETTMVLVAAREIGAREPVTAEDVVLKEVRNRDILPGALRDKAQLVGTVAKTTIFPGEQIIKQKLMDTHGAVAGLSFKISPGKRALTIRVDNVQGLAGLAKPGDRVDVLATVDPPQQGNEKVYPETVIVAQNVRLLAVNQLLDRQKDAVEMATATLEVSPEEAQAIVLAGNYGKLHLSLRGPQDSNFSALPPMSVYKLLDRGGK